MGAGDAGRGRRAPGSGGVRRGCRRAYLHGSAVLGGLRPWSDVDVLVVVRRPPTPDERRALVRELLEISGERARRGPARPVELTIVVQSEVRPWRYPPTCAFLYGEWLRDDYERGEVPSPSPSPDLAPLITMVLLGNAPLSGPPPAEVLDPIPPGDLVRGIVAGMPALLEELESDTRNVLLTLARIWTTVATGVIRSKDAAADWALARLPAEHRPRARPRAGRLPRSRARALGRPPAAPATTRRPRRGRDRAPDRARRPG
ncbi:aminoglycoside adenylyltransferase domain-containing protein [Nonomuraea dietziae]|uniref:aminoglycoside adenylyltransferase domain-containing protein n=1 Tax=Nonomuraea dietziae TaxID=65515 RepID=UPI0031D132CE